jgi:hypothetical protein
MARGQTHPQQRGPSESQAQGAGLIVVSGIIPQAKVKNLSVKDKQCILLMDEVALKKGLRYCKMRDIVVGYVDDGVERSTVMANSALVFMVRGLFKR